MNVNSVRRWMGAGVVLSVMGCSGDSSPSSAVAGYTTAIEPSSFHMTIGDVENLRVVVKDADGKRVLPAITWTTTDPSVASVRRGAQTPDAILTANTEGSVTLRAQHPYGVGEAQVTVADGVPLTPKDFRAFTPEDAQFTSIGIQWSRVVNATGYRITRRLVNGINPDLSVLLPGDVSSFVDTGLGPGLVYVYQLFAVNSFGSSPPVESEARTVTPELNFEGGTLPWGRLGVAYDEPLGVSGGSGEYEWTIISGSFPPGLTLESTGRVQGVPESPDPTGRSIRIKVVSGRRSAEAEILIRVAAPLSISPSPILDGYEGQPYRAALTVVGGVPPYTWEAVSGTLPAGLTFSSTTGEITGIPSGASQSNFTVRVSDGVESVSRSVTLRTRALSEFVLITTRDLPTVGAGENYEFDLEAVGGGGAYEWSIVGGNELPGGLELSPTGRISGRPYERLSTTVLIEARSGPLSHTRALDIEVARVQLRNAFSPEAVYATDIPLDVGNAMSSALAKWGSAIEFDLEDVRINSNFDSGCGIVPPTLIDDVLIFAYVGLIDGPGGAVAVAGPCVLRGGGPDAGLPLIGAVIMDLDDLTALRLAGLLEEVVLHEVGHVLGIGTVSWPELTEGDCSTEPRFRGDAANHQWKSLGKFGGVPMENLGAPGDGSNCSHWRESEMGSEIMTPIINLGRNPLSRVTLGALFDLGYTVDEFEADQYRPGDPAGVAPESGGGFHLRDRLIRPELLISPNGVLRPVILPGG